MRNSIKNVVTSAASGQSDPAGQASFASRDGDSAATYRHCFTAGTRVATEHGLIPIEEVPQVGVLYTHSENVLTQRCELPIRLNVASRGAPRPALFWVNSGIRDTVLVSTRRDYSVRCTPNEPFLILNPRMQLEWKEACALQPGDLLCLSRSSQVHGAGGVPFVEGFRPGLATAQFAGLLSGEVQDRDGAYVLAFHKHREAHFVGMLALEVFGTDLRVRVEPIGKRFELILEGNSVTRFVKGLRPDGQLPRAQSLPEALFRASPAEAARFCLGLCQSTSGAGQRGAVPFLEFALATREAAQGLKIVLLQLLGVVSGRIYKMQQGGYLLRVAGRENLRRFFGLSRLALTPELVAAGRAPRPWAFAAPNAAGLSEAGCEAAAGHYYFEPVRSVEAAESSWVYSLTVPRTHAFVANGFVVHHTECRPAPPSSEPQATAGFARS